MTVAVLKTKAEQALIDDFERVAERLPGGGTIAAARKAAIGRFAAAGLPHRRNEEWKYTDLRARVSEVFTPAVPGRRTLDEAALVRALGPELGGLDCIRLVFVDGALLTAQDHPRSDHGCHYGPLSAAIGKPGYDWITTQFVPDAGERGRDAMLNLNAAFVTDGALIRVDAGAKPGKPIHLVFVSTGTQTLRVTTRNLIRIDAGAEVSILESHVGLGSADRQTNTVTHIDVAERARVDHIKLLAEGRTAQHIGTWIVDIEAKANYRAFQLTVGGALVRNQVFATFKGAGAKLDISGAFLARGTEHVDTTLVVDHAVPHCQSRELFKGVLDGRARGVVQGKVIVRPGAQKTDGKQMAQVLMLSEDAEFDSKPELEIYADDVVCGHGSTSAEIDPDLVFYCRSRGIPEQQARALLIESFIGEAIDKVDDAAVREGLRAIALGWLGKGGGA